MVAGVLALVSACSSGGPLVAGSTVPSGAPAPPATAAALIGPADANNPVTGCVVPPQPRPQPAGGWLSGSRPEWLRPTGPSLPPSLATRALAVAFAKATDHGYTVATSADIGTRDCLLERYVGVSRTDGATGYLAVLQLKAAIQGDSFPISVNFRELLPGGSQLIAGDFAGDGSLLSAVVVRRDGLLVFVLIESAHSPNTSGWPTTMATPSTLPDTRAPLTLGETVALAARAMSLASAPPR